MEQPADTSTASPNSGDSGPMARFRGWLAKFTGKIPAVLLGAGAALAIAFYDNLKTGYAAAAADAFRYYVDRPIYLLELSTPVRIGPESFRLIPVGGRGATTTVDGELSLQPPLHSGQPARFIEFRAYPGRYYVVMDREIPNARQRLGSVLNSCSGTAMLCDSKAHAEGLGCAKGCIG